MTTCTASFTQNAFRGREDDGNETTANWKDAQNTNWNQPVDTNFRVRFQMQEGAGCAKNNVVWRLQYNLEGAGWVDVTGTSSVVRATASPNLADAANLTDQLTGGTGTFQGATGFDEANGDAGGASMDLAASGHAEAEYCVQLRSADVVGGQTIQLRVTDSGNALASYTQTPTITAAKDQSVSAGLGALVLTGLAPTPVATELQSVSTGLGALTLTGYAPAITESVMVSPGLGALTITGYAPTVAATANWWITTGLGELGITGYAPTPGKTESVTTALGELVISGFAPDVSATDLQSVVPDVGLLSITGYAPTVSTAGITLRVSWVEFDVLSAPMSVSTGLGEIILTGYAPVVQVSVTTTETARRTGGAKSPSLRKRRRTYILPSEDGYEKVVVREAEERKPLQFAVEKIYIDATQDYAKPVMADVDRLIAKMAEMPPVIMPGVKRDYIEEEDEEWLLMH